MALSVLAILPIKPLKDGGIFRRRLAPGIYEQSGTGEAFHLELPNLSVRASLTTDRKKMVLDLTLSDGKWIETIVPVVARYLPMGDRWFFTCPCCGRPRDFLIVMGSKLVCSTKYLSEPSTASKARRRAALLIAKERLIDTSPRVSRAARQWLRLDDAGPSPFEEPTRQRRPRDSTRASALSTNFAIDNGHGAGQYDIYDEYRSRPTSYWRSLVCDTHFEQPSEVGIAEHYPVLDIGPVIKRLAHHREGVAAKALRWGERPTCRGDVLFFADWRDGELLIMACFDYQAADRRRWQRLDLSRHERGRYRWICSFKRSKCDLLYLRDGILASREALRLVKASQRASGKRTHAKAAT